MEVNLFMTDMNLVLKNLEIGGYYEKVSSFKIFCRDMFAKLYCCL